MQALRVVFRFLDVFAEESLLVGDALSLGLDFGEFFLFDLDVLLQALGLLLEFVALIALRITAPELNRPYCVPWGSAGPWLVTAGPTFMIVLAALYSGREQIAGMNAFLFGSVVIVVGVLLYPLLRFANRKEISNRTAEERRVV